MPSPLANASSARSRVAAGLPNGSRLAGGRFVPFSNASPCLRRLAHSFVLAALILQQTGPAQSLGLSQVPACVKRKRATSGARCPGQLARRMSWTTSQNTSFTRCTSGCVVSNFARLRRVCDAQTRACLT